MSDSPTPQQIIAFWSAAGPKRWFKKSSSFDDEIRTRFEGLHVTASRGALADWTGSADGALALLLLLDQFPRNLYRGSAHAFATDPLALSVAKRAVAAGHDQQTDAALRPFFYLPFEHSERMEDQTRGVELCQAHHDSTGDQNTLDYAIIHRDIIARFGHFPHRNACLGRATTTEEQAFLDEGGFAG